MFRDHDVTVLGFIAERVRATLRRMAGGAGADVQTAISELVADQCSSGPHPAYHDA